MDGYRCVAGIDGMGWMEMEWMGMDGDGHGDGDGWDGWRFSGSKLM